MVVEDVAYDFTEFIDQHPGGKCACSNHIKTKEVEYFSSFFSRGVFFRIDVYVLTILQ